MFDENIDGSLMAGQVPGELSNEQLQAVSGGLLVSIAPVVVLIGL